jgi:hypothetical protein
MPPETQTQTNEAPLVQEKPLDGSLHSACSVIRPPNLVQIGDLWICENEEQLMPDKIEFALLIQCSSAQQARDAMRAGKIEFTLFEHYSQNAQDQTRELKTSI